MKYVASDDKALSDTNVNNNGQSGQINWNDLNYPCLLKLFHYTRADVPEEHRRLVFLLWLNHILIWIVEILNIIANIAATASGFQDGIRIGISFTLLIIWVPLSLYLFYLPYMILLKGQGSRFVFYLISFITVVFFIMWSIADFADANGFIRMGQLFSNNKTFAGIMALLNSIVSLIIGILAGINAIWVFRKR